VCVCVFKNDWRVPHMLASRSRPRCSDGACDVRCASPPPSRWWGACAKTARGGATTWVFSLPPSFSSLLLENRVAIVKNQKNLSVCLLSQIRFSFYWLQYIWPWIIYWVNLFFFYFIISHLIFISDLVLIFLIAMYLVLNHLSSFFSNSSPYTWLLDSVLILLILMYMVLNLFIELICLLISSLDILFLYQIWSLLFWLLFVVVLILFLLKLFFNFIPYNLVLFLFLFFFKFGSLSF
jgi:hypothetical protein